MAKRLKDLIKKNRKLMIFVPFFIIYIILVELVMGIGLKNNSVWDKGEKWSKE
ncbi:MAG: hypothetical protein PWQ12_448 [Clostridiales bacterium]|nr:hypothetical protein [Clostridiales bacterium]